MFSKKIVIIFHDQEKIFVLFCRKKDGIVGYVEFGATHGTIAYVTRWFELSACA